MQSRQHIFIAQRDTDANARKQRRKHKGMAGMLHNQRRAEYQHSGAGDARQKANQQHQNKSWQPCHREDQ